MHHRCTSTSGYYGGAPVSYQERKTEKESARRRAIYGTLYHRLPRVH